MLLDAVNATAVRQNAHRAVEAHAGLLLRF
jgi:hypothetical protein